MRIVIDAPKRHANLVKHGIDFDDAAHFDWRTCVVVAARDGRSKAIGTLDGVPVTIVYRLLGTEGLSIVSMRPSSGRSANSMARDKGYTDLDMAEVSDNPEWTEKEFACAEPFAKAHPDLAESLDRGITIVRVSGGIGLSVTLNGDVAAYYGSFGDKAEARLNADLRKVSGLA